MANFKRKGPKSTRAGCLLCKPHKLQNAKSKHWRRSKKAWGQREDAANLDGVRDRSGKQPYW